MGHVFVHLLHFIHTSLFTSNLYRDIGLNNPYMAPKGHINLQKGLAINIEAVIVNSNKNTFQEKIKPIACLKEGFIITKGIPASKVPAGQMYLQKKGSPMPNIFTTNIGRMITNTRSIKYLEYFTGFLLDILNFFEGILCINS